MNNYEYTKNGTFTVESMKCEHWTGDLDWSPQYWDRSASVRYIFPEAGDGGESIFRLDLQRSTGRYLIGSRVESDFFLACLVNDALEHTEQEQAWAPGTYRINLAPAAERLGVDLTEVAQPGMVRTSHRHDKVIAEYDDRDIVAVDGDRQTLPVESLWVIAYTKDAIASDSQVADKKYDHVRDQLESADYVIVSVQAWSHADDADYSNAITPWRVVCNMIQDFDKPDADKRTLTKEDLEAAVRFEKDYTMVAWPIDR